MDGGRLRAAGRGARPYVAALLASAALGGYCTSAIVARAGHPALPLDDAFIHLQYARRLAEGGFYAYVRGEGYTTGATSPIWPALLAPFHALGVKGLALVYVVWAFGTLAHAALAVETGRVAYRLAGATAAVGAAAMCLVFGGFAWFAWSGMETVPFAWMLMRTARVASEHREPLSKGQGPSAWHVALLGLAAPLFRPEGAVASLIAAIALATRPGSRRYAPIPLLGALLVPLANVAMTGHAASSTATVKWLVASPYYAGSTLIAAVLANVRLLLTDLLDGGPWTAVFLPSGSRVPILLGLVAIAWAGHRRRLPYSAAFVVMIALGTLIPCTYLSFLWNRVRYIWPFAGAWCVGVACLAAVAGELALRLHARLGILAPLLLGGAVGALASKLPWAVFDLAQSASAIDRQQVELGLWAHDNLPDDARIGVNDTGAIAYMSDRRTFDVVGLTTEGEARYWAAGAGSRFEHYERLPRERLPTHFIVYPQWMACPPVLGAELVEATVTDQSILGGVTMVAYEARYDMLGSGALPSRGSLAHITDELDVADLEAEAAHGYELGPGAWDQDDVARVAPAPEREDDLDDASTWMADGGRMRRASDVFFLQTPAGAARLVLRVSADEPVELQVAQEDREIAMVAIPAGSWVERVVAIPASGAAAMRRFTVTALRGRRFGSFHYWIGEP